MRIRRFVMVALVAACFAPFARDLAPTAHAQIAIPYAVASESYYRVDTANGRVRKVSPSGTISTVAGDGTSRYNPAPSSPAKGSSGLIGSEL